MLNEFAEFVCFGAPRASNQQDSSASGKELPKCREEIGKHRVAVAGAGNHYQAARWIRRVEQLLAERERNLSVLGAV